MPDLKKAAELSNLLNGDYRESHGLPALTSEEREKIVAEKEELEK